MKSFFSLLVSAVLLILLLLLPHPVVAEDEDAPNISDFLITTSQTHLLLFCTIKNGFTPEMIEGVRNGIPVSFTFLIKLEQIVGNWFDSTLVEMSLKHTLTYDPLKEKYTVTLSEQPDAPVTTGSLDQAIETMTELSGIRVYRRDELEPDAPYALHVKATLAEKILPMNMHYFIPFVSLWNFETDWRTIEFKY